MSIHNCVTFDIEDWFHILDSPVAPDFDQWSGLDSIVHKNTRSLLDLCEKHSIRSTMFWLGWVAERYPDLVRECHEAGHEIASHGYAHVLAYEVGPKVFGDDTRKGKAVLEHITGREVKGFRAAGFSTKDDTMWTFEEILNAGHTYDSSIFPSSRGHGGMPLSRLEPHRIHTGSGTLIEIPQSMISIFGQRISLFGGGYLRLAPLGLIEYGIRQLEREGRPLVIYLHPREIDPDHPRLPLSPVRKFKCYVNLRSTLPKLEALFRGRTFIRMDEMVSLLDGELA